MSLSAEDITAVVAYRKEKAHATLREVEDMIATEHWNLAVQRMYYACFYTGQPHCCSVVNSRRKPITG